MTRISDDVAWVRSSGAADEYCLVARVPDHEPIQLLGSAVDLWLCWAEGLSLDETVARLSDIYGVPAREIRPPADDLYRRLRSEGYLTEDGSPSAG